jgi:hypothetical protein
MLKLRRDLSRAVQLLTLVKKREKLKKVNQPFFSPVVSYVILDNVFFAATHCQHFIYRVL